MIKFSEFFERVLQQLHEKHDFAAPGTYLMNAAQKVREADEQA